MRLTPLFILFISLFSQQLISQQLIALNHQGDASFYPTLAEAYDSAENGDTLYLPGGLFNAFTMDKSLALIGVGYHPDSTGVTGQTILSSLTLGNDADTSSITGIQILGPFVTTTSTSNIIISRCFLNQGIVYSSGTNQNWILTENWIGYYTSNYSIFYGHNTHSISNCIFSNNVIKGRIFNLDLSEVKNNIFLSSGIDADNSTIENNIFIGNSISNTSFSHYLHNLNSGVNGAGSSNNTGFNNYLENASLDTIFVNYAAGNSFLDNDFHVVNPSYIGTDGTPIGIYGGLFPWKEGGLPFTPHVRAMTIAPATDTDGKLHINFTVKAQGN